MDDDTIFDEEFVDCVADSDDGIFEDCVDAGEEFRYNTDDEIFKETSAGEDMGGVTEDPAIISTRQAKFQPYPYPLPSQYPHPNLYPHPTLYVKLAC